MELVDEQGPRTRKLAIMPGRGVELGVTIRDSDTEQLKTAGGALVEDVRTGSAAEKGRHSEGRCHRRVRRRAGPRPAPPVAPGRRNPEGRTVKAAVMRSGKRMDLTVTPAIAERAARSDFEFFVPGPDHMPGMPREGRRFFFSDEPQLPSFERGDDFFMPGRGRLGARHRVVDAPARRILRHEGRRARDHRAVPIHRRQRRA